MSEQRGAGLQILASMAEGLDVLRALPAPFEAVRIAALIRLFDRMACTSHRGAGAPRWHCHPWS
jgi:hypothetical protein